MSNLEIIRAHYAAGTDGDLDGMVADYAEDMVWTEMAGAPQGGTYHGRQAIIDGIFSAVAGDWENFTVDVDELLDAGDTIVALAHYRGTARATGRPLDVRVAHVWRLRDGQIVAFEQFADTHGLRSALGG